MNPWLAILFFALAACHAAAEPSARAVLLEEKMFTLVANGKSVGECRVLKGATVTVLSVDGDKVLVSKSPISSAWVPKSALQMESPAPEPSQPPEPVPEKESGVIAKGKEAVGFLKGALKDISTSTIATDLAKKAGEFAAAPSSTPQPSTAKPVAAPVHACTQRLGHGGFPD
jgi:hypothetical protein